MTKNIKIAVTLIQELRNRTGLGMMDCKKALVKAEGNISKAVELLRKKGIEVSEERASKDTYSGLIHTYVNPEKTIGVIVEINCETDFVASTQELKQFAKDICLHIVLGVIVERKKEFIWVKPVDVASLLKQRLVINNQYTIEEVLNNLMGKVGENIKIRRFDRVMVSRRRMGRRNKK